MDFQKTLDSLMEHAADNARALLKESEALGKAAIQSTEIVAEAGRRLLAGNVDLDGATHVAMQGVERLETLARGAGNLAAAGFAGYLKGVWDVIKQVIPVKL